MSDQHQPPRSFAHLGAVVMYLRQRAGLTRKAFGEAVGLSETTIRAFECGRLTPRTQYIQKVLRHPATKGAHELALAAGIEPVAEDTPDI